MNRPADLNRRINWALCLDHDSENPFLTSYEITQAIGDLKWIAYLEQTIKNLLEWREKPEVKGAFMMSAIHSWGGVSKEFAEYADRTWKEAEAIKES